MTGWKRAWRWWPGQGQQPGRRLPLLLVATLGCVALTSSLWEVAAGLARALPVPREVLPYTRSHPDGIAVSLTAIAHAPAGTKLPPMRIAGVTLDA